MGYDVIYVDFQSVILHKGKEVFWRSFGEDLNTAHPELNFSNMNGFKRIFAKSTNILPRPTVLIIDEFSDLYAKSDRRTKDSILGVLRSMSQDKTTHNLHSFLGLGTFNITQLIGYTGSPFSVRESVECPPLSSDDVTKLFKEYSSNSKRTIDQDVIDDIWYKTSGHAGSVSFIGRSISEHRSIRSTEHLTIREWNNFVNNDLLDAMAEWAPMQKLKITLEYPFTEEETHFDKKLIATSLDYLFTALLYSEIEEIRVPNTMQKACKFLTAEGVLTSCGGFNYKVFYFNICIKHVN